MELEDRQKKFLDEIEDPVAMRTWLLAKIEEGRDRVVIKNGRQMTFTGVDVIKAAAEYLDLKSDHKKKEAERNGQ